MSGGKHGKHDLILLNERLDVETGFYDNGDWREPTSRRTDGAQTEMEVSVGATSYANVASSGDVETSNEYVELDTTFYNDCRHVPSVTMVTAAIRRVFGEDKDRRTIAPWRTNAGVWKLETPNIDRYRPTKDLEFEGKKIAKVTIRTERVVVQPDGKIRRQQTRGDNDMLITLRNADSFPLNKVSDDQILEAIIDMDIGSLKRAPQRQFDRRTNEFSGNKFFVLEGVSPTDRGNIPNEFVFLVPSLGKLSMLLSHKHRVRFCSFCGKRHEAVCEMRQKLEALKKERDALKQESTFTLKVCGDSTMRYMNEVAVQGDVEAMSGATAGNILNSLDVDDDNPDSQHVVMVTGSNEVNANISAEEYIYTLQMIRERVGRLLENKKVAMVAPPTSMSLISAEIQVKDEFYRHHLEQLAEKGVKVWENPIVKYDEDFGDHPTVEQTIILGKYIHKKVLEDFGVPMLMVSATDDMVALPNKYSNLTSFYKYGCGACDSKVRNKWRNICDACKDNAHNDEGVKRSTEDFKKRVTEIEDLENPTLSESEDDELRCETCDVIFQEITDLRQHFKDRHPQDEVKYKRGRSKHNDDDGKKGGRRVKSFPTKSLSAV